MIPVYSIAKPFLAQAILELGLNLDEPVSTYLTDLSPTYGVREVGALLNHTSGLADYSELTEYQRAVATSEEAWTIDELLARCETLDHRTDGFRYSNIGYLLLTLLLTQQTKQPYFDSLTKLVFEPLRIRGVFEWKEPNPVAPTYDPAWVYSGTFLAEPEAIGPALAGLARHRAATIGLTAGLTKVPYPNTGFDQPGYNFGFMVDGGQGETPVSYVGHGGGGPGMQLMAMVEVSSWKSAVELSPEAFDQTITIKKMRAAFEA